MFCFSYSAKYVKEYIEGAKPIFSVGEYWDSCNYNGYGLDYNQGNALNLFFISEIIRKRNLTSFSSINLSIYLSADWLNMIFCGYWHVNVITLYSQPLLQIAIDKGSLIGLMPRDSFLRHLTSQPRGFFRYGPKHILLFTKRKEWRFGLMWHHILLMLIMPLSSKKKNSLPSLFKYLFTASP